MTKIIEFENDISEHPLLGKLLMLNIEKTKKFSSKNFIVTTSNPVAFVGPDCFFENLQHVINEGILIDISNDKVATKALKEQQKKAKLSKVKEKVESTVFVTIDENGRKILIVPKDKDDENALKLELSVNGFIKPKEGISVGISKIMVSKVDE